MKQSETKLEIRTLGSFSISVNGKPVATDWPDETLKVLFCSLLSPLDVSFSRDRICRSLWHTPASQTSMLRLEELFLRPLSTFLACELGINPLIEGNDGIRIDLNDIHVDAHQFHSTAVEGLRLMSLGKHADALGKFRLADTLYAGSYLPGIPGRIIADARADLESIYKTAVKNAMPRIHNSGGSCRNRMAAPGIYLMAA